jgi:NCS1 family nucleobase:cation symporter-1
MFTMSDKGAYWYTKGYNKNAVYTILGAGIPTILIGVLPKLIADLGGFDVSWLGNYTWFIGCGLGYLIFLLLERANPQVPSLDDLTAGVSDGSVEVAGGTLELQPAPQ